MMVYKKNKVLINSIPKAGTYFFSDVLSELGVHQTYFHLGEQKLQAYDPSNLQHSLRFPRDYDVMIPISQSHKLVRKGEFAVGHLSYSNEIYFKDFKVILAVRRTRDALQSFASMALETRKFGDELADRILEHGAFPLLQIYGQRKYIHFQNIARWSSDPRILMCKYEDLKKDISTEVKRICDFLSIDSVDVLEVGQQVMSPKKMTLTKSSGWAKASWCGRCEDLYKKIGFSEIDRHFGYVDQDR